MSRGRVLLAMSGGIDSSVAAVILKEQDYEVVGATLALGNGEQAAADAAKVCRHLGIEHYNLEAESVFRSRVIQPFLDAYLNGLTPNPCIRCNALIKFNFFFSFAEHFNCNRMATGHYARIVEQGKWELRRGIDSKKDQSYFLFLLSQKEMERTLFPLGNLRKDEVRKFAQQNNLPVAHRPESQEICFIPDDDIDGFFKRNELSRLQPGDIVDESGKILGHHEGIHKYTIGQRRGLGIAAAEPLYVLHIDADSNRIIIGPKKSLERTIGLVNEIHWCGDTAPDLENREYLIQIRYRNPGITGNIQMEGSSARITFEKPITGWTPGQAAVFYSEDQVIGGGWIVDDHAL